MRMVLAALALMGMVASAQAQSTTANVPTGVDVAGCANYRIVNGKVVQVCDKETPKELQKAWRDHDTNSPGGGDSDN